MAIQLGQLNIHSYIPTVEEIDFLSDAISSKIFIKNGDTPELADGAYGKDLSVIKISMEDYELGVINQTLSHEILYVISSDYSDAYGENIQNLSTTGIEGTSEAANIDYVKKQDKVLSGEIVNSIMSDLSITHDNEGENTFNGRSAFMNYTWFENQTQFDDFAQFNCIVTMDTNLIVNSSMSANSGIYAKGGITIDRPEAMSMGPTIDLTNQYIKKVVDEENELIYTYPTKSGELIVKDDLDKKIFIKNGDDPELSDGAYGKDLSVIKINRAEYELGVINQTLSHEILYVVSSDYLDAYEQPMQALSSPDVTGTSYAANTLYVNDKISKYTQDYSAELTAFFKQHLTDFFDKVEFVGKDKDGNQITCNLLCCKFPL